jgi:hypothetical protein
VDKRRHTAYQQDQLFFVGRCVLSFEFVNGSRLCNPELAVSSARLSVLSHKSIGQHTGTSRAGLPGVLVVFCKVDRLRVGCAFASRVDFVSTTLFMTTTSRRVVCQSAIGFFP